MGLRTALEQSKVLTFASLLAVAWTLLNALQVLRVMEGLFGAEGIGAGTYVGQVAASGVVGTLVLAAVAGLLVYLLSELGETAPAPSPWPPE